MSELRQTPFYRALNRPHLLWGGERKLMILAMFCSIGLMVTSMNLLSVVVGTLIAVLSVWGLRRMAKADPLMSRVYARHVQYSGHYAPFSRPWRESKYTRAY